MSRYIPAFVTAAEFLNGLTEIETDDCVEWPFHLSNGYGRLQYEGRWVGAHRVVLTLAIGDPPTPAHDAAHGPCHNRACVNPRHLRWATRLENRMDCIRDGTHNRGDRHPRTRLTEAEVREIRSRRAAGEKAVALGDEFGVSRQSIHAIYVGRSWRFV